MLLILYIFENLSYRILQLINKAGYSAIMGVESQVLALRAKIV